VDYTTVQEAAEALGLSIRGVRERIERGEMQAQRMGARLWVIPRDEVERWRGRGKLKPGPKPRGKEDDRDRLAKGRQSRQIKQERD
jgi:excisionase family DNA binding protein